MRINSFSHGCNSHLSYIEHNKLIRAVKAPRTRPHHRCKAVSMQMPASSCSAGPRIALQIARSSAATVDYSGGSGSDGGSGAGGPPKYISEMDPEDEGDGRSTDQVLAEGGTTKENLPKDLQDALQRGAISGAELQQWLNLAARPLLGPLCSSWPAFRDRVLGNPRFLLVLAVEEVIGCTAKTIAEYQMRKEKFWKEIDFVVSDLSLEVIGDFAIVWLLSPKKVFTAAPTGAMARVASKLPGHVLQIGSFSLAQRLGNVLLRSAQFFGVGFFSSALGHSLTIYLAKRKKAAILKLREDQKRSSAAAQKEGVLALLPIIDEDPEKELAPVLENSLGWGTFMATSANLRYQMLNGFEERVLVKAVPNRALNSALTVLLRFSNTLLGSAHWIWSAKMLGLQ